MVLVAQRKKKPSTLYTVQYHKTSRLLVKKIGFRRQIISFNQSMLNSLSTPE